MALYTELCLLREEERVLMKIASRLNDQLNRLKVWLLLKFHAAYGSMAAIYSFLKWYL
jgi:snRNA-activating protein complex subunit 19, SNAPc subunit 19